MKYFDIPRQVKFFCPDEEGEIKFENGIAYQDEIICAYCGSIYSEKLTHIPYSTIAFSCASPANSAFARTSEISKMLEF